jgi:diaminopimelate epimerase
MRKFSKYEGAGNDFIFIDNLSGSFLQSHVTKLCDRKRGIGADGLILLERSERADFRMRIFNADGGEAAMCGNGLRCLGQFVADLGFTGSCYCIETGAGVLTVSRDEKGSIWTELVRPREIFWEKPFVWQGETVKGYAVDTGVPHLIFFTPIEPFPAFAQQIRLQENMNVTVAELLDKSQLKLRTYERGVEAETLACGTAAAAASVVAEKIFAWEGPRIYTMATSGDCLTIDLEKRAMTGPVAKVFDGSILF